MPKKTRKEKLLAQKRRASPRPVVTQSSDQRVPATQTPLSSYTFQTIHQHQKTAIIDQSELDAIRKDVLRTVLLAIIAIGIEFGLYWKLSIK